MLDRAAAVEIEEPDIPEHLAHADEVPPTKLGTAPGDRILGHGWPARGPLIFPIFYVLRVRRVTRA